MPNSKGYRKGTRSKFSRAFREHGPLGLSTYLRTFRMGDYVDIKVNSSIHKGMPHHFYHGRTGKVFDVTPRALGVIVNKRVRNRIIPKRIHVRIEHVQKSKCRDDFLERLHKTSFLKNQAHKLKVELKEAEENKNNEKIEEIKKQQEEMKKSFRALKRLPQQPKSGFLVEVDKTAETPIQTLKPLKFIPHF
ncbi:ribosomal protein L21 [Anaeramoeba ignava]|uniref:Ribosomal protein L21 n=1 Tax=Anaeramoeba ignava TaxID=1746090 RepID=A0A9Q0LBD1_ANAIG|nr:ribosomal protein L21 [Anaeramoeba ignava]|eukprot:Anaeramoba_ignava/a351145_324.p2 GENE.a351145_324~~a351145_324.p2  ORF type:complete len:191 (-),score=59.54 a351145_324:872-1444(-)